MSFFTIVQIHFVKRREGFSCLERKPRTLCIRCGFLKNPWHSTALVSIVTSARPGEELLGGQHSSKYGPAFPNKINMGLISIWKLRLLYVVASMYYCGIKNFRGVPVSLPQHQCKLRILKEAQWLCWGNWFKWMWENSVLARSLCCLSFESDGPCVTVVIVRSHSKSWRFHLCVSDTSTFYYIIVSAGQSGEAQKLFSRWKEGTFDMCAVWRVEFSLWSLLFLRLLLESYPETWAFYWDFGSFTYPSSSQHWYWHCCSRLFIHTLPSLTCFYDRRVVHIPPKEVSCLLNSDFSKKLIFAAVG